MAEQPQIRSQLGSGDPVPCVGQHGAVGDAAARREQFAEHLLLSPPGLVERLEDELIAGREVVEQHPRARSGRRRHLRQRQTRQAVAKQLVGAGLQQSGASFGLRASTHAREFFT